MGYEQGFALLVAVVAFVAIDNYWTDHAILASAGAQFSKLWSVRHWVCGVRSRTHVRKIRSKNREQLLLPPIRGPD